MKNKKRAVLFIIIIPVAFVVIVYGINQGRIANGQTPLFIYRTEFLSDGGTKVSYSFGIQYIQWKKLSEGEDDEIFYLCGTEVHYLFDFVDLNDGPNCLLEEVPEPNARYLYKYSGIVGNSGKQVVFLAWNTWRMERTGDEWRFYSGDSLKISWTFYDVPENLQSIDNLVPEGMDYEFWEENLIHCYSADLNLSLIHICI